MKTVLLPSPLGEAIPTKELMDAVEILLDNVSHTAKLRFEADNERKVAAGKSGRKGMQSSINEVIKEKFVENGWNSDEGRFHKNRTFVRVTFRHSMSMGTDILDAYKEYARNEIDLAAIFVCELDSLKKIAPSQADSMVSYSKLMSELRSLVGVLEMPLIVGEMIPKSL